MPRLLGERVMLREYKADDIGDIRKWVNDAETTRYLSTRVWPPQTMVDSEEFLSRMLQSSHNAYNFVIADRGDERYIGQLDMFRVDWRLRLGELGMVIGSAANRGQGLGREALELMQRFAFRTLGLERLEMEVHMENHAARQCYQKAGFVLEGVKRLANVPSYHMRLESAEVSEEGDFIFGMVTNSRSVGGFKNIIGRRVHFDDGVFEVTFIRRPQNAVELQEILGAILLKEINLKYMCSFRTARLEVMADGPVPWTLDGEYGGECQTAIIQNHQKALEIRVNS